MNRSQTNNAHAHTVRVDAFVGQMQATERAKLAQAIDRYEVAELERSAIARRIKQARQEAGMSQPEMAEALGVIPRAYQNYESVKKPRVPWGSMNDIAKLTGKSTEWLIHGDGVQTPDPFAGGDRLERLEKRLDELLEAHKELSLQIETATVLIAASAQTLHAEVEPDAGDAAAARQKAIQAARRLAARTERRREGPASLDG